METISDKKINKGTDEKGIYCICPKCGKKCRYQMYSAESYFCECADCNELLDED